MLVLAHISIHAAREGGDKIRFNQRHRQYISIHAAREGGDADVSRPTASASYFNPRRP